MTATIEAIARKKKRMPKVPDYLIKEVMTVFPFIKTEIEYADDRPVENYVHRKTEKILDFGTEKVIWIFTTSLKIMIAGAGKDWVIGNWDKTVDAIEGVSFNIAQYLQDQGITLEEQE